MLNFILSNITVNHRLDNNSIYFNQELAEELDLLDKKEIILYVGQTYMRLKIYINNANKSRYNFSLSSLNLKKLYLRNGAKHGIRSNDDEVHVGPVVGVMADFYNEPKRPFGGQTYFIRQLLNSGKQMGQICFAFSPYSVDLIKGVIIGYTHGKNGWVKGAFPIPDVIYPRDRSYSRSKLQMRKRLEGLGVSLLNPTLVGKWETHKILSQNKQLRSYLPETRLLKSFNEVGQMLTLHRGVYLKPVAGSQGRNIIKVTKKRASGVYEYQYMLNNRMIRGSVSNTVNLQKSLKRIMGNRSYIVQKQINLLKYEDNIIDVRILVQKDNTGVWDVTGMACRVGSNGSITSNISSGGSGRKIEEILMHNIPQAELRKKIMNDIHFISIEATKTLEKSIGQSGEMGIDLGIDEDGKVWFIEANIRPARQVFNLIGETDTRLLSVERPMLYARYLAGF